MGKFLYNSNESFIVDAVTGKVLNVVASLSKHFQCILKPTPGPVLLEIDNIRPTILC